MGGGSGGGGTPTTSTSYTSNLPEYARPYFERMMGRAEAESNQPYVSYQNQRIAGFTPDQSTGFEATRNIAERGAPEVAAGTQAAGAATLRGLASSGYQSNAIQQSAFGQPQAEQYMSPYMNEVVNRQKAAAERDYAEGRPNREAAAIKAGAFGGYRSAIQEGVAQRGLGEKLSDIEAYGRQKAYENAQSQFERDRAASMGAQQTTEQQRLAAAQYGLSGAGLAMQGGQTLGQLGSMQQGLGLQASQALQSQGATQQAQTQKELDTAYQDFINQRDWEKQQTAYLSNILRGVPVQPQQVINQYQNPNPLSQYAGLGIAGLGLARSA
jgi:hypothetical protein